MAKWVLQSWTRPHTGPRVVLRPRLWCGRSRRGSRQVPRCGSVTTVRTWGRWRPVGDMAGHTPIGRVRKWASPRGWAALTCLALESLVPRAVFGAAPSILLNPVVLSTWCDPQVWPGVQGCSEGALRPMVPILRSVPLRIMTQPTPSPARPSVTFLGDLSPTVTLAESHVTPA